MVAAAPAVPETWNVTGLPLRPLAVAVSVLVPTADPRVQLVSAATPLPFVVRVVGDDGAVLPPPAVTANVTWTPPTGLPCASVTMTDGEGETWVPAVADAGSTTFAVICVAVPAVTLNPPLVAGLSDPEVAESV